MLSCPKKSVASYVIFRLNKSRYALLYFTWLIFESGWSMMDGIVWEFRVSFCEFIYFGNRTWFLSLFFWEQLTWVPWWLIVSEGKKIIYSFVLFQELVNSHTWLFLSVPCSFAPKNLTLFGHSDPFGFLNIIIIIILWCAGSDQFPFVDIIGKKDDSCFFEIPFVTFGLI